MNRSLILTFFAISALGCSSGVKTVDTTNIRFGPTEPFVDPRDGRSYRVVQIGRQVWMARNIAFPTEPSWCYGDDPGDCEANGRLYPWEKAREACPGGWRLPTEEDWQRLEYYLVMPEQELVQEGPRGTDQGARLRKGGSTDFNAPISGYRRPDGTYARRGERSAYWTATETDRSAAWHRDLRSDDDRIYRSAVPKEYALSVRCVSD